MNNIERFQLCIAKCRRGRKQSGNSASSRFRCLSRRRAALACLLWLVGPLIFWSAGAVYGEDEGKQPADKWRETIKTKVAVAVEDKGIINYEEGYALARGAWVSQDQNKGIANVKCLRQARVNGNNNLVEVLKRIRIDNDNTMERLFTECDVIGRTTEGYLIKSASTTGKPLFKGDGSCEVEVKISLKGTVLKYIAEGKSKCAGKPLDTFQKARAPIASGAQVCKGVIVDARGAGVAPALFPRLVDEKGAVIFDFLNQGRDIAAGEGTVVYGKSLPALPTGSETSKKPVTVKGKAAGADGRGRSDVKIGAVQAQKLKTLEEKSHVLSRCRTVIVVD